MLRSIRAGNEIAEISRPGKRADDYALDVRVVEVTPELAAVWLGSNIGNRNTKPTAIDKYARDMQAGRWLLTGEPLIFDADGVLRNGQNRLHACVKSGATFVSVVIWGVEADSFAEMDRNVPRTIVDILKIAGVNDAARKVAVLHYIWRAEKFGTLRAGGKRVFTVSEAQDMLDEHPEIVSALDWYGPLSKAFLKPPALGVYLYWTLARVNAEKAEAFFHKLTTGADLKEGDAVLVLRELLQEGAVNTARRSEYDQDYTSALVYAAWKLWNASRKTSRSSMRRAATKLDEEMKSGTTRFGIIG